MAGELLYDEPAVLGSSPQKLSLFGELRIGLPELCALRAI